MILVWKWFACFPTSRSRPGSSFRSSYPGSPSWPRNSRRRVWSNYGRGSRFVARLKPFTEEETALYIDHRLRTAGYPQSGSLFTRSAVELIARYSEGIPRNINNLCFNALSVGYALKRKVIDGDIIREVIGDLDLAPGKNLAPLPQLKEQNEVPAAVMAKDAWSRQTLSLAKVAIVCAALTTALGVFWAAHHRAPRSAPWERPVWFGRSFPQRRRRQRTLPASSTVLVSAGQTLCSISMQRFGSWTPELLQQILSFNPSVTDPNVIRKVRRSACRLATMVSTIRKAAETG